MMPQRALYSSSLVEFLTESTDSIIGKITQQHSQHIEFLQTGAWQVQIEILQQALKPLDSGHLLFEAQIPRMGRRADVVLIYQNVIFVIECKIGAQHFHAQDLRQAHGYALDLHHFHADSHNKMIVPMLLASKATNAQLKLSNTIDNVFHPVKVTPQTLLSAIELCTLHMPTRPSVVIECWLKAGYHPTPTIIEAAQALYANHDVNDISRNDAGAVNLEITSQRIQDIVHQAKLKQQKAICFVTGVPGAGKTLVGLNIATSHQHLHDDEHAVFLSGNGPLVEVLTEALARDAIERGSLYSKAHELRSAEAKIQNIHRFRDESLKDLTAAPPEKVVIFDEAQRAWDLASTAKFMTQKRGQKAFNQSEPDFLISVMDRHCDWCVIVALIGGGQEINTGEAGLQGWVDALVSRYPHWSVHFSDKLSQIEYAGRDVCFAGIKNAYAEPSLHLSTSMRSFRAETLSHMIHYLIANEADKAAGCYQKFSANFSIKVTRDLTSAKNWIKNQARANETKGLIASSGGIRLKPEGIFVKNRLAAADWFLNSPEDVRSCHYLEDVATEFDIQGLELDWSIVAWDTDYRYRKGRFEHWKFTGSSWKQRNKEEQKRYLENAYRVLLTRARQGLIVFVPKGDEQDDTRLPEFYDETYDYLVACGLDQI